MAEELDRATVKRVAALAKLKLDDAEVDALRSELSQILAHIQQLEEVSTDSIEPLAHAADLTNRLRADEHQASLSRESALQNAPQQDGEYFLVPAVFEGQ